MHIKIGVVKRIGPAAETSERRKPGGSLARDTFGECYNNQQRTRPAAPSSSWGYITIDSASARRHSDTSESRSVQLKLLCIGGDAILVRIDSM
jgi:hypothetical protein